MKTDNIGFVTRILQFAGAWLFRMIPAFSVKTQNAAEVASYMDWLRQNFGVTKLHSSRQKLWSEARRVVSDPNLLVLEFGVAWGYTTSWWLKRLGDKGVSWIGFDLFSGLPRAWRNLDAGHFDAGGLPPKEIIDTRVVWKVGDVSETVLGLDLVDLENRKTLIFFDLDLFEPTKNVWEHIRHSLKPGDVIYFDEAFDLDERKVLNDLVLPEFEVEVIGCTAMALCLMLKSRCLPASARCYSS